MTSTADRRRAADPSFIFVGGKGGVGKTTCAAAIAVAAARRGRRTLAVSVDPAHSLGDALARPLGPAPRRIAMARGTLAAVEVDAARALERWLARRRPALGRIALRGTWLDADDVTRLLRLSLPGIDELAALVELTRLAGTRRYDVIVVDTAPTGHTLRLLAMPGTLGAIARVFEAMQARHHALAEALGGRRYRDADDDVIAGMEEDARTWIDRLRDPAAVELHWVTLPEPMAVEETRDAVEALSARGIAVSRMLVNRLTPLPETPCDRCAARRALESRALRSLRRAVAPLPLAGILEHEREPRGIRALIAIAQQLSAPLETGRETRARAAYRAAPRGAGRVQPGRLAPGGTRLLLFGGKGGVGKTTTAAAAAIAIAAARRRRRVLLISTDPAHSLGDVLGEALSNAPRRIPAAPANLEVRELDAAESLERIRTRYATAVEAAFDRLGGGHSAAAGVDATYDRAIVQGLIELAPPGIDELAAVLQVVDALDRAEPGRYDLVVIDTAPSGHALRLLEMPAIVHDWTRALMSILLKYRAVVGLADLGPMLLDLSRGLGRLRELLTDPERTRFVAVTRGALLPRAETGRLLARLAALGIAAPAVVVNAVGRGAEAVRDPTLYCRRCRRAAAAETREIAKLSAMARRGKRDLILAPAEWPPPSGAKGLARWVRQWRR